MKKTKKLLGVCGVDSGQLMITDPCYINSEWSKRDFEDIRKYKNKKGKVFQYKKDFKNYESKIDGKTVNELIKTKEWTEISNEIIRDFSYGGCCSVTLGENGGQLNCKKGHEGVGVVFSSGYGDGCYEVWGTENKEGRIIKVEIIMG